VNHLYKINTNTSLKNIKFNDAFNIHSSYNLENYIEISGNLIHITAIVNWERVEIGQGNVIGPYSCIGTESPNISNFSNGNVKIGNQNLICEYVTIHLPTNDKLGTIIGSNNILMSSSHIAHDCILGNDIVLCNNSAVAGHARIMDCVTLALNSSIHQFKLIGSWSMVGMNTCINKSIIVEPGNIYFGVPAKKIGKNIIGLRRKKITKEQLNNELQLFNTLITNENYL